MNRPHSKAEGGPRSIARILLYGSGSWENCPISRNLGKINYCRSDGGAAPRQTSADMMISLPALDSATVTGHMPLANKNGKSSMDDRQIHWFKPPGRMSKGIRGILDPRPTWRKALGVKGPRRVNRVAIGSHRPVG